MPKGMKVKDLVKEPNSPSEFEIQAILYYELRKLGLNIRGEVRVLLPKEGRRQPSCRFDLVEFVDGQLVGIIEVKPKKVKKEPASWHATRQGLRYTRFGVPVRLVYGMRDAEALIAQAEISSLWD